jgi:hypothetical protein
MSARSCGRSASLNNGSVTQRGERGEGSLYVVRDQLNDDIDVFREPQISVRADRQSPGDEIADAAGFKGGGKGFKAGEFHEARIRSFPS